jgi:hypothetical protein
MSVYQRNPYNAYQVGPYAPYPVQMAPYSLPHVTQASNIYLYELEEIRKDWHDAVKNVSESVAKIIDINGQHIGCGILIGIDRLLMPAHLLNQICLNKIKVEFDLTENVCFTQSFNALNAHEINVELDYCILQLSRAQSGPYQGYYPGERICFPVPSFNRSIDEFLLVHTNQKGTKVVSVGQSGPCSTWGDYLCSNIETVSGSSGGAYFDKSGALIAMHLHRLTGNCGGSDRERRAVYMADVIRNSQILSIPMNRCQPICDPLPPPRCFSEIVRTNECYINEGKPAVTGAIYYNTIKCGYWETRPRNCNGEGPRGIKIALPSRGTAFYDIEPNPHSCRDYNKNARPLYDNAAEVFFNQYAAHRRAVDVFQFEAYGQLFTATMS